MTNIAKSQPAPKCLSIEKNKVNSKRCDCEGVKELLVKDFFNKCYLCEEIDKDGIVEHFQSHRQGEYRDLMFDWNNLMLCCDNCNRIKGARYDNILNCTDITHKITEWVEFKYDSFPKIEIRLNSQNIPKVLIQSAEKLSNY